MEEGVIVGGVVGVVVGGGKDVRGVRGEGRWWRRRCVGEGGSYWRPQARTLY